MNPHLEVPSPSHLNANDSRQASKIDGINDVNRKAAADSKTSDCMHDHLQSSSDGLSLRLYDVVPIFTARERLLHIVVDHFIVQHVVQVPGSEAGYSAGNEKDKPRKRKSGKVRYEGDPRFVLPLMYVENIYETLVNEVNVRLASLDGVPVWGTKIGVDLEAAGGLYSMLAKKFPEKGRYTFKRRELATLGDTRTKFPELVLQLEKGVRFVVVNGLDIVEKPSTMSLADAQWLKRLTGRSEVSIPSQDYKLYVPRHKDQVKEAIKTNSVAQNYMQYKVPAVRMSYPIDHTQSFTTNETFENRDEAMEWVIRVGKENQTVIAKNCVSTSCMGNVTTCWMKCERYGSSTHRMPHSNKEKDVLTATKRCGCPFSVKCYSVDQGPWKIEVVCGMHNHKIGQSLHSHTNDIFPSRSSFNSLRADDVVPIQPARKRLLHIILDHFIVQHVVQVSGSEAGYSTGQEKDKQSKRKSGEVRYEGDPRFVLPLMYVENIYEALVNEVNVRLAFLHGFRGTTIGVDLEAAGGLYNKLARKFPEKGPFTFKRSELATLGETRTKFPELVVQEEKGVHFVVVNGLDIVEKPSTMSLADAEWFKRLTGRSEVSIPSQDYKLYFPRHKYQGVVSNPLASITGLPVGGAIKTNIVAQTNVQTKQPIVPMSLPIDHTQLFTTNVTFKTSDEAMEWVRRVGKENQTVIDKYCTSTSCNGTVTSCWMKCVKYGSKMHGMASWNRALEEITAAKRFNCPFRLKCYTVGHGPWKVEVVSGMHNHEIGQSLHNHTNGRLTEKKYELTKELFPSQSLPKQVLPQIKDRNPTNVTTMKEVNNARYGLWEEDLGGRTILQHFLAQTWVLEGFYFKRHREATGTDGLNDLVFAHTNSLALLRAFPYVLIVDATFQGNRFKTPFFEVRGVASTCRNFNVACAFVAAEREDNYVWALKQVSDMCWFAGKTPTTVVIVTDPDQALLTAVKQVFPDSKHLLCRNHIYRSIKNMCLTDTCLKSIATAFVSACKTLFETKTESLYKERLNFMEASDWKNNEGLIEYLKQTWLTPYKDKIVSAWTDNVMHFGTHDTVRDASPVKNLLNFSSGSDVWERLHSLLKEETLQINNSFLQSQKKLMNIVPRVDAFRLLQHGISEEAIKIMAQEYKCLTSGNKYSSTCECKLRVTHGLPCAHEMLKFVADRRRITLDAVHEFWRQLNLDVVPDESYKVRSSFIDSLIKLPHMSTDERRRCDQIFEKMGQGKPIPENLFSSTPNAQPPVGSSSSEEQSQSHRSSTSPTSSDQSKSCSVESIASKPYGKPPNIHAKPSKNPYVEEPYVRVIPKFMVPYVTDFCDYSANGGHSGFQAIAEGVEHGEDGWRWVRGELFKELVNNSAIYAPLLVCNTVEKILKALAAWTLYVPLDQQFSYPEMGHIVATHYQLVYVVLGQQCVTFLPLYADDQTDLSDLNEICLVSLYQGSRFISVTMDEESPLPPIHPLWAHHHQRSVDGLDRRYGERFKKYEWFQSFMGWPPSLAKLC